MKYLLIALFLSGCASKTENEIEFNRIDPYEIYCYNGMLYITSKHGTHKLYETCLGEQ